MSISVFDIFKILDYAGGCSNHIVMGRHDALRLSGRAGGVDDAAARVRVHRYTVVGGRVVQAVNQAGGHVAFVTNRQDREQLATENNLAALGIVSVVFVLGMIRGEEVREMFLTAIALAVAAVPEGPYTMLRASSEQAPAHSS